MTTWMIGVVVGACIALTPAAGHAQGAIYRWVDVNGTVSFGQSPPGNRPYQTLTPVRAPAPVLGAPQSGDTAVTDLPQSLPLPPALDVTGAPLSGQPVVGREWDDALLNHVGLDRTNLNGASFRGASLIGATLAGATLQQAVFREANLRGANVTLADLRGATINDANLGGLRVAGATLQGASVENANLSHADLRGADLRGLNLRYASLAAADLRGANLQGARLARANLKEADLRGADLRGADLRQVAELTTEQVASAYLDAETQLPASFGASPTEVPSAWVVSGKVGNMAGGSFGR